MSAGEKFSLSYSRRLCLIVARGVRFSKSYEVEEVEDPLGRPGQGDVTLSRLLFNNAAQGTS